MARTQYQKTFAEYAVDYSVSLRTINRWAKKGFPLDDPDATKLAAATQRSNPIATSVPAGPGTMPAGAVGELGLSASIRRLQESEAAAHRDYLDAIAQGNEVLAAGRMKVWTALAEQLRKTELSNPEVAEANRNTISVGELKIVLTELFSKLRQDLDSLPKRVALELIGKDEIGIREVLARETGELIGSLYACKFLEGAGDEG